MEAPVPPGGCRGSEYPTAMMVANSTKNKAVSFSGKAAAKDVLQRAETRSCSTLVPTSERRLHRVFESLSAYDAWLPEEWRNEVNLTSSLKCSLKLLLTNCDIMFSNAEEDKRPTRLVDPV